MTSQASPESPELDPPSGTATDGGGSGRLPESARGRRIAVITVATLITATAPLVYYLPALAAEPISHSYPGVGSQLTWMLTIIGLVGGATTPIVGKLADIHGKKRLLLACTSLLFAGSLICAVTSTWALFLAGRSLQAMSFGVTAIVASLLRDVLPRRQVTVAVGALTAGIGGSLLGAPFLVAALTDNWGWRSMFWFLAIYAAALIPAVWLAVPESDIRVKQRLDWLGSLTLVGGAAAVLVYISQGQEWGWAKATSLAYLVGGIILLYLFVLVEQRVTDPIIDLQMLRNPQVSMVLIIGFLVTIPLGIQGYALAYMAQTPHADVINAGVLQGMADQAGAPVEALAGSVSFHGNLGYALGFSMTALAVHLIIWQSIPTMISGPIAGVVGQRRGLRLPFLACMIIVTGTTALYAFFHGSWLVLLPITIVFGLAFGLYYGCDTNLIIEAVPAKQQGVAAGTLVLAEGIGTSLGTAILAPILAAHPYQATALAEDGSATTFDIPQVYTDTGWTLGYLVSAAIGAVCIVLVYFMRAGRTPATGGAHPIAEVA
jgi:MFS family permease